MHRMTISACICSKKSERDINPTLRSLCVQSNLPDEVIIIYDSSKSDTRMLDVINSPQYARIRSRTKVYVVQYGNIAKSRNLALKVSTHQILLFLDDDVLLYRDLVKNILLLHGKYLQASGFVGKLIPTELDYYSKYLSSYFNGHLQFKKDIEKISVAPFCLISLKKEILNKYLISFDEAFESGEDIDFLLRLRKLGENVYFSPKIVYMHNFDCHNLSELIYRYKWYSFGIFNLWLKHHDYILDLQWMKDKKVDFLEFFFKATLPHMYSAIIFCRSMKLNIFYYPVSILVNMSILYYFFKLYKKKYKYVPDFHE